MDYRYQLNISSIFMENCGALHLTNKNAKEKQTWIPCDYYKCRYSGSKGS